MRRALDTLYFAAAALAALFLAGILVIMMAQVAGREFGLQVRGADDLTAWFCAAASFLALGYTFKQGELVRVGLFIERLSPAWRRRAEIACLAIAAAFSAYMAWAVMAFVYESWKFNEQAQGLIAIPIWIPQASFAAGVTVFCIAVADELARVLRGAKPGYQAAEEERLARGDFSDTL
jgi:TRAP-type C4-dicarboxylate transport system permease small subunit